MNPYSNYLFVMHVWAYPSVPAEKNLHLIFANNVILRGEAGSLELLMTPQVLPIILNNTLAVCHCPWFQRSSTHDPFLKQVLATGRCVSRGDVYLDPLQIGDKYYECQLTSNYG